MEKQSASQLRLRWQDGEQRLPKLIEREVRALLAQLLRAVVEAERGDEEAEGE